jgi:plasmid stabilization system protein ParE
MAGDYRVIVSPLAFADLNQILEYIALQSPQGAGTMTDRLLEAMGSLALLPKRHPVFQARGTDPPVHSMPVDSFLVYYEVIERLRMVRVLSVQHGARQHPRF